MHVYLIVSQDFTQAFVYSNLIKAKEKQLEIERRDNNDKSMQSKW